MSIVNRKHEIFIKEMILHGDQVKAYLKAYPKVKHKTAITNSGRLLLNAAISGKIKEKKNAIEEAVFEAQKQEAIRLAKKRIADVHQIDAELSEIVFGHAKRKKKIVVFNKTTEKFEVVNVEEEPDFTERIAAGDKLYKRKGSYAPKEIKHEGGDSFLEFFSGILTTANENIPNRVRDSRGKQSE